MGRTKLQLALFEAGIPQWRVAASLGVTETRLSRIASGRISPTPHERERLAELLDCAEAELFESPRSGSGKQ